MAMLATSRISPHNIVIIDDVVACPTEQRCGRGDGVVDGELIVAVVQLGDDFANRRRRKTGRRALVFVDNHAPANAGYVDLVVAAGASDRQNTTDQ